MLQRHQQLWKVTTTPTTAESNNNYSNKTITKNENNKRENDLRLMRRFPPIFKYSTFHTFVTQSPRVHRMRGTHSSLVVASFGLVDLHRDAQDSWWYGCRPRLWIWGSTLDG